jgi:hypothetical protein
MPSAVDGLRAIGGGAMVESFARFTHPTCPALSSIKNAPAFIQAGAFFMKNRFYSAFFNS